MISKSNKLMFYERIFLWRFCGGFGFVNSCGAEFDRTYRICRTENNIMNFTLTPTGSDIYWRGENIVSLQFLLVFTWGSWQQKNFLFLKTESLLEKNQVGSYEQKMEILQIWHSWFSGNEDEELAGQSSHHPISWSRSQQH